MDIYYQNSNGVKLYLDRFPYKMLSANTLFDYEWEYTTKGTNNPKIVKFTKNMVKKDMSIVVGGTSLENYYANIDYLLRTVDVDIFNVKAGKLYIGNCYLSCYIVESQKSNKYINIKTSTESFTIVAENGNWINETTTSFGKATAPIYNVGGLDYPYDYPYDYANSLTNQMLTNSGYSSSEFEITVFGSCENPAISVGTHTYLVNTSLITGEYFKINSISKTIIKTKNNGEEVSIFSDQGRDFYIFEKIPSGNSYVAWSGGFGFDIKLMSGRSEPLWI